jgi:hypothetical protein
MRHNDLLEQLEYFRTLWTKSMPEIAPPPDPQLLSLLGEFSAKAVTHAVMRTQRKFRTRPNVEPNEAWRYCGGVASNEQKLREGTAAYPPAVAPQLKEEPCKNN